MTVNVRYRIKGTRLYVSPLTGARAEASYEAGGRGERLARWLPRHAGPNSALAERPVLRGRSRDIVRNNGYAETAVAALVANIVGTGITPQFRTPDAAFNRELADAWDEWTDESDADGRLDFYGQQALAVRSMIEGGETFARLRIRRAADGLSVPLQLQLLESEYCPDWKTETAPNGNMIVNGIELDVIGARAAYWLYRQHPGDFLVNRSLGMDMMPVRVPASEVVHLAQGRRPGAGRGEPWLARALVKLRDLDKYDDAQLVRQQIAALFAGFVEEDQSEEDSPTFAGQSEASRQGVAIAPLEPGTMQVLPPGRQVKFSSPPTPGDSYEAFMHQQQLAVASSAGILYEMLTGDYSQVNDRTWRAAVNEFRRRCETWQHHLVVFQLCRPVLERWTDLAILARRIRLPQGITAKAVVRAEWLPVPWGYINPLQDVQARRDEIRAGLKSRSQSVSEQGYDVAELDAEIAGDNARADELGLVFDSDPRRTAVSGAGQSNPAESDAAGQGGA